MLAIQMQAAERSITRKTPEDAKVADSANIRGRRVGFFLLVRVERLDRRVGLLDRKSFAGRSGPPSRLRRLACRAKLVRRLMEARLRGCATSARHPSCCQKLTRFTEPKLARRASEGRRRGDEAVANLREVLRDVLVLDDGVLLADFRRGFLSELHVLLRRVLFLRKLDHRLRRQARCKFLQDGGRNLPIASLAPERHIGIDRRGAAGGQVAGEKRGAD